MECNACKKYKREDDSDNDNDDRMQLSRFRPIDYLKLCKNLYDAILFPERSKGFKMPANFQLPTYTFQSKQSIMITTNTNGHAFVQVNLAQFMADTFVTANQSNLFTFNSANGSAYDPNAAAGSANALTVAMLDSNRSLALPAAAFNAVRAGPMAVKYEYIGRLDVSSGTVTMGISYSSVSSTNDGLQPDITYGVLSALEDTPFARTVPVTESLRGVYVPHDYTMLNLKPLGDASSTVIPQRLFIIIAGCPNNNPGATARITIVQNWEALPKPGFADVLTTSYKLSCPRYSFF